MCGRGTESEVYSTTVINYNKGNLFVHSVEIPFLKPYVKVAYAGV